MKQVRGSHFCLRECKSHTRREKLMLTPAPTHGSWESTKDFLFKMSLARPHKMYQAKDESIGSPSRGISRDQDRSIIVWFCKDGGIQDSFAHHLSLKSYTFGHNLSKLQKKQFRNRVTNSSLFGIPRTSQHLQRSWESEALITLQLKSKVANWYRHTSKNILSIQQLPLSVTPLPVSRTSKKPHLLLSASLLSIFLSPNLLQPVLVASFNSQKYQIQRSLQCQWIILFVLLVLMPVKQQVSTTTHAGC